MFVTPDNSQLVFAIAVVAVVVVVSSRRRWSRRWCCWRWRWRWRWLWRSYGSRPATSLQPTTTYNVSAVSQQKREK
jgi:hypothetical protein